MRDGSLVQGEYPRRRKDGEVIWIEYSARALFDQAGQLSGYVSVHRDVTDRKRSDATLIYQARLLEVVTEPIIALDRDGRITYWNSGAERTYGWTSSEAVGRSFRDVLHNIPDPDWEVGRPERLLQVNTGKTVHGEYLGRRKDDSPIRIEFSTRAFFEPDGQISGYVAVHRDVTERRRIEQTIAEQAFLLAHVSDAVIGLNLDFEITYWSPSAERLYGFRAARHSASAASISSNPLTRRCRTSKHLRRC